MPSLTQVKSTQHPNQSTFSRVNMAPKYYLNLYRAARETYNYTITSSRQKSGRCL